MDVQKLGETVDDLQGRSRDVFVLVREANKYWLTYFFHHLRQENPDRIYDALLTGWIRQVTHPHCLVKLSWICLSGSLDAESFLGLKVAGGTHSLSLQGTQCLQKLNASSSVGQHIDLLMLQVSGSSSSEGMQRTQSLFVRVSSLG